MKNNLHKILFGFLILVLVLLGLIVDDDKEVITSQAGNSALELEELIDCTDVHFLDVGQGDAIYIRTPDEIDVLIDGGPDKNVLSQLGSVMPYWDRQIDIVILTHPHSDHVSGLVEVLRRFEVGQVYYSGAMHTAPDYLTWLEEIKNQEISLKIVDSQFDLMLGEYAKLEFLWPQQDFTNKEVSNLNNVSIVNRLVVGENAVLLTGDIEKEIETLLVKAGIDLKSNILKSAHHGSSSSNTQEFINEVNPDQVVVMCGEENRFGHPNRSIINRYNNFNIDIRRTDQEGRISYQICKNWINL